MFTQLPLDKSADGVTLGYDKPRRKHKMNTLGHIATVTLKQLNKIKNKNMFVHDVLNQIAVYKGQMYIQLLHKNK